MDGNSAAHGAVFVEVHELGQRRMQEFLDLLACGLLAELLVEVGDEPADGDGLDVERFQDAYEAIDGLRCAGVFLDFGGEFGVG